MRKNETKRNNTAFPLVCSLLSFFFFVEAFAIGTWYMGGIRQDRETVTNPTQPMTNMPFFDRAKARTRRAEFHEDNGHHMKNKAKKTRRKIHRQRNLPKRKEGTQGMITELRKALRLEKETMYCSSQGKSTNSDVHRGKSFVNGRRGRHFWFIFWKAQEKSFHKLVALKMLR